MQKQITDRAFREKLSVEQTEADLLAEKQPPHDFATPEQLGALAVFQCGDAAAQITGAPLPVDSGWTVR